MCLFSNFMSRRTFLERIQNTSLLFHIVTIEGSGICHNVLSVNVCFQHIILGTVNATTVSCTLDHF